jgi:hypothetical protein
VEVEEAALTVKFAALSPRLDWTSGSGAGGGR